MDLKDTTECKYKLLNIKKENCFTNRYLSWFHTGRQANTSDDRDDSENLDVD